MLSISNYHYVRKKFTSKYPSIFGVKPIELEHQLLLLKNQGNFISINMLIDNIDTVLESKDNFFLITFDDGLKEQYKNALPILEKLKIPAVFFANSINYEEEKITTVHKIHLLRSILPSSYILKLLPITNSSLSDSEKKIAFQTYCYDDKYSATLKYILNFKIAFNIQEKFISNIFLQYFNETEVLNKLYMSKNELQDLAKRGFLGSHTHSHYPLGLLSSDKIFFELQNSKKYFEELTHSKIKVVSYPYGNRESLNEDVIKLAKDVGYKLGFSTQRGINGINNNLLLLNRFDCNDLIGGKNYTK